MTRIFRLLITGFVLTTTLIYSSKRLDYHSQIGQDKWVVEEIFNYARNGFFLELGASDGVIFSNTYVLEKELGWNGICIEPNPEFYKQLVFNRDSILVNDCVDHSNHTITFKIGKSSKKRKMLLGGIIDKDTDNANDSDNLDELKKSGLAITMTTKTLEQILDENNAPRVIDYFSFDVEGAETRILRNFPFEKYTFLAISIERPTPELNKILFKNGYVFVKNNKWDTYYVHKSISNFDSIHKEPFVQHPGGRGF